MNGEKEDNEYAHALLGKWAIQMWMHGMSVQYGFYERKEEREGLHGLEAVSFVAFHRTALMIEKHNGSIEILSLLD